MDNRVFKTRKQIALDLNISYKTLVRVLKRSKIEIPKNRLLTPAEYEVIYKEVMPQEK